LGTLLSEFRELRAIIHVTDGAPCRGSDAADAGANSREEYVTLRRREFENAMRQAGVRADRHVSLWCPDQEAPFRIAELAKRLASLFQRFHASFVFTHSYEGGHPDHDACAAAVRSAVLLLERQQRRRPEILEFTSYHACSSGLNTECFLGHPGRIWRRPLDERQRQFKSRLLSNYVSQQRVLCQFPLLEEPLRMAPRYNMLKPPHKGQLYYEQFEWGINGRMWRRLASHAMNTLGFCLPV